MFLWLEKYLIQKLAFPSIITQLVWTFKYTEFSYTISSWSIHSHDATHQEFHYIGISVPLFQHNTHTTTTIRRSCPAVSSLEECNSENAWLSLAHLRVSEPNFLSPKIIHSTFQSLAPGLGHMHPVLGHCSFGFTVSHEWSDWTAKWSWEVQVHWK